jgi:hypothetical protein
MLFDKFISDIQRFVAISAVGVSALRGQGVGILKKIHEQLGLKTDLSKMAKLNTEIDFKKWHDQTTDSLMRTCGAKWGAARKALNLFLRDCLYNKYLNSHYRLDIIEHWLEIPLDSVIAKQLKRDAGRGCLPLWPGLKRLKKNESIKFQEHASFMAMEKGIARVHLDIGMWVNNR